MRTKKTFGASKGSGKAFGDGRAPGQDALDKFKNATKDKVNNQKGMAEAAARKLQNLPKRNATTDNSVTSVDESTWTDRQRAYADSNGLSGKRSAPAPSKTPRLPAPPKPGISKWQKPMLDAKPTGDKSSITELLKKKIAR